jgi:acyl carrier protein
MEERLKKVFSEVFDIEVSEINDESSPDNIEEWDSLNHSNLIMALEQEFDVSFTPDEMIELLNFELVKIVLKEKTK